MLSATCKAWPLSEARSSVRRAGQGTTGRFGMHRVCGHRRAQARRDGGSARVQPAALPLRRSLMVKPRLTSRPRRSPEAPLTSPARSGRAALAPEAPIEPPTHFLGSPCGAVQHGVPWQELQGSPVSHRGAGGAGAEGLFVAREEGLLHRVAKRAALRHE